MCTFEILPAAGLSHHTSTAQRDRVLSPLNSNALFMLASHWVYPEFEWLAITKTQITWHAQSACWQTGLRRLQKTLLQSTEHAAQPSAGKSPPLPVISLQKKNDHILKFPSAHSNSAVSQRWRFHTLQEHLAKGKSWKSGVAASKHRTTVLKIKFFTISSGLIHVSFSLYSAE